MELTSVDFRNSIANKLAIATETVYLLDKNGNSTGTILYKRGEKIGIATGYVYTYKNIGSLAEIYRSTNKTFYTIRILLLDFTEYNYSGYAVDAQSDLDKLLKTHAEIRDNLIAASTVLLRLEQKGIDCTIYRNNIKILYSRLAERNQELLEGNFLENKQSGGTYLSEYSEALNRVLNDQAAVGLAPIAIFLIKASVISAFALVAYFTIKNLLTGGKSDLSEAQKLVKSISKLDPATAKDVTGLLKSYYGSTFGSLTSILLVGGGGFLVFKYILPQLKK